MRGENAPVRIGHARLAMRVRELHFSEHKAHTQRQKDLIVMQKKMIIALSAVLLVSASAVAYEDPENRIGDRYPLLEPAYRSNSAVTSRWVARPDPFINDDLENKIGDRYPSLEPSYRPALALTPRQVARLGQAAIEDPENKIGDKYPLLESRAVAEYQPTKRTMIRTIATTRPVAANGRMSKRTAKQEGRM